MLIAVWHWFFPLKQPSPAAQESLARNAAVTAMLRSDQERWETLGRELDEERRHGGLQ